MPIFTTPIPLSLYVHLPWCVRKCPYCDFNSHVMPTSMPEDDYVTALIADLEEQLPKIWGRRLTSIFFGGGTPSLFSAAAIERILMAVNTRLPFHADLEITLEANPGTVEQQRFKDFRTAGVNRLSIGVQSLQDDKLTTLGRIHNRDAALRAIDAAKQAGFSNFNLDLMHGLPNQSAADAVADIQTALSFHPKHLSWYQLTIEPNTFFHHQPPQLPVEEMLWDIQEQGQKIIAGAHYLQYEVSAYAQAGYECAHNKNYWEFGDYLGIGAGAHSKLTDMDLQQITRHWQVKNPKDYLNNQLAFTAQQTIASDKDILFEFMLNALRLTRGVSMELFVERTGLTGAALEPALQDLKQRGLLHDNPQVLCATELGQRFLNDVLGAFLL